MQKGSDPVFDEVDIKMRIAQEEIFGPVLAMVPAADFDEGLEIANSTVFGLTGAVYSRSRERLERARRGRSMYAPLSYDTTTHGSGGGWGGSEDPRAALTFFPSGRV